MANLRDFTVCNEQVTVKGDILLYCTHPTSALREFFNSEVEKWILDLCAAVPLSFPPIGAAANEVHPFLNADFR
jgi:hypothetical protein